MGPTQIESLQYNGQKLPEMFSVLSNQSLATSDSFSETIQNSLLDAKNFSMFNVKSNAAVNFMDDLVFNNLEKSILWHRFESDFLPIMDLKKSKPTVFIAISSFSTRGSFVKNTVSEIFNFIINIYSILQESLEKVAFVAYDLIILGLQIIITISEMSVQIPLITNLWKRIISPTAGDLNILHFYSLFGSLHATTFFKLYWKKEPISPKDLIALENTKDASLFLYSWNNHPLTRTDNERVKERRREIFDAVIRMASVTYQMITKPMQTFSQTKNAVALKFIKISRLISSYMINIWSFPLKRVMIIYVYK
jgi:hypothetical protein